MACKASSSTSICRKRGGDREKTKDDDGEDKISKFPDEILGHILSFIHTRDAIRTGILSRRWRYVWISSPCIELDNYYHGPFRHEIGFDDLVDKLLCLKKMYFLRKFSLRWNDGMFDQSRVNEWISNAITGHSVEVLELVSNHCYELPHAIFTSKKLVSLTLGWAGTRLNVPVSVCLPSLRIIHLHGVRLCNDDSMKNLLHGCPVLEELKVDDCLVAHHMTTLFVRSSSLKRVYFSTRYFSARKDTELPVVIDAPNLQLLVILSMVPEIYALKDNLSSLVEARLALDCSPGSVGDDVYGNRLHKLLEKISNIKYMTINPGTMGSLPQAHLDTLPTFHNLTGLFIRGDRRNGGRVLPCLLERSPNLKNLGYSGSYLLQCREPKCLMLYLEKIRIEQFKGGPVEMKMVMYFLKNAPVLKKMSILPLSSSKEDLKILEKVSVLPRTSTACVLSDDLDRCLIRWNFSMASAATQVSLQWINKSKNYKFMSNGWV